MICPHGRDVEVEACADCEAPNLKRWASARRARPGSWDEAMRRIRADAWDEGARAATADHGIGEAVNPYR